MAYWHTCAYVIMCAVATHLMLILISKYGTTFQHVIHTNWMVSLFFNEEIVLNMCRDGEGGCDWGEGGYKDYLSFFKV